MNHVDQLKRSMITRTVLERASRALPSVPKDLSAKYEELTALYNQQFARNEFTAALDTLEQLSHLLGCRGGYWRDLERAAESMDLPDRLPRLRQAFVDALGDSQGSS
jgi:hypothetical protein